MVPKRPRRISGYNLDLLLSERSFDVAGLLVGHESTPVTVLRAAEAGPCACAERAERVPCGTQRLPFRSPQIPDN
jgi:hypothetical protein